MSNKEVSLLHGLSIEKLGVGGGSIKKLGVRRGSEMGVNLEPQTTREETQLHMSYKTRVNFHSCTL